MFAEIHNVEKRIFALTAVALVVCARQPVSAQELAPQKASTGIVEAPTVPVAVPAEVPQQPPGLEEIVVTAQKRTENVQDTPISIAVLGQTQLQQRGISGFQDLFAGAVPSLRAAPQAGRSTNLMLAMRGITSGETTQISRDAAIGIYVDGVYLGRSQGLGPDLLDVERIEVLRGPQGTLFGRNAVGGAISIVSKRPTGEFGGEVRAEAGNYDLRRARATINLPEFAHISIKLDGTVSRRDGFINNPQPGAWSPNQFSKRGLRAQVLWEPSNDLDFLYSFDISKDKSVPYYVNLIERLPGAALAPIFSLEPNRVKTTRVPVPLDPSVGDVQGHSLNISWRPSDALTIRSITAYRKLTQTQDDNDYGYSIGFRPNGLLARRSVIDIEQDQFSQEIQLVGTLDRLKYVVGAYYFEEDANDSAYASSFYQFNAAGTAYSVLARPQGGLPPDRATQNHAKSMALFAQATWTPSVLADKLHLTAGARYTHDKKHGNIDLLRGLPSALAYEFSSKRVDPTFTLAYDLTDDINAYVKYSQAYRAGGANSRSSIFRPFKEEEARSWEAGLKSEFWDRRVRLNLAIYDVEYRDLQVDFLNPSNPSATETLNAGKSKVKGVEVDLTVAPVPGLALGTSYSYTDANIPPQISPFTGVPQIVYSSYTAKHTGTVSADYALPLGDLSLLFHVDGNYSTGYYAFANNAARTNGYFVTNGRLTIADVPLDRGRTLSLAAWGKNLFKEQFEVFPLFTAGTGQTNLHVGAFNDPRTFGLEATLKY